jgi:hypothetical protein
MGTKLSKSKFKPVPKRRCWPTFECGICGILEHCALYAFQILGELDVYWDIAILCRCEYSSIYLVLPFALAANYAFVHIKKEWFYWSLFKLTRLLSQLIGYSVLYMPIKKTTTIKVVVNNLIIRWINSKQYALISWMIVCSTFRELWYRFPK